jgi:UDPglucose 6-dehydrogenase
LAATAKKSGYESELLNAVESVNNRQKEVLFRRIHSHFGGELKGKTIALWGLAFKPNTDDMREAPSRPLMEALWAAGARVQAYDPVAMEQTRKIYGDRADLGLCESAEKTLDGADALAIATEWREFRSPNFDLIKSKLAAPVIFDGRNLYDPRFLRSIGFLYYGIGRGDSVSVPAVKHERRRSQERRRAQGS